MRGNPCRESRSVPRLHEHCTWTCKLADQPFSAADTRDDATARNPLHDILTIPSDKMTVVNVILFTLNKLRAYALASGPYYFAS